jgi:hypothetical protein
MSEKREDAPMANDEGARREVRILPAVLGAGIALAIAVGVVAYAAGHYGERTRTITTQAVGPSSTGATPATVSPLVAAGAHTFVSSVASSATARKEAEGLIRPSPH